MADGRRDSTTLTIAIQRELAAVAKLIKLEGFDRRDRRIREGYARVLALALERMDARP